MTLQDEECRDYARAVARAVKDVACRRFSDEREPILGPAIIETIQEVAFELDEWLPKLLILIEENRRNAGELEHLVAQFGNIFTRSDTLPLIRPWVFVVKRFREIVLEVQSLTIRLLEFHEVPESANYDSLVESTNATLRAIDERAEQLSETLGAWGRFVASSHPDEALVHLSSEIGFGDAAGQDWEQRLHELKMLADECFYNITDETADCPPNLDMILVVAKRQVELLGDFDKFLSIARLAYQSMMRRPEKARLMVESPDWIKELTTGLAISYFDGDTASAVVAATRTQPGMLGGLLNLGKDIVESWSRLPVSTLLALRSKSLEHWQRQDAGAALKAASQGETALLVADFPMAIRNAAAHHSWRLAGDEISFVDNRGEARLKMKWPELSDALLAGTENYIALVIGLSTAAAVMGADMTAFVDAAKAHLPYELNIRSTAAFAGHSKIDIEERGERLVIKVPNIPIDIRIIGIAAGLAEFTPDSFKELEIFSEADRRKFISERDPLRRWLHESRPALKHGMLWSMLGKMQVGDAFLISQSEYEVIIARCAFNFFTEYPPSEARSGLELTLATAEERSRRLYRALSVFIMKEEERDRSREEKSLLTWLARRASLPMPALPGWQ
ncbi:hypothetical protein AB0C06_12195 [Micromonospora inaquosa]|uniref:hypothetical protein n=1 Tax=Micromonospora inaquosa TaxID=2203716 RepID=UPI0033D11C51